MKRNVPKKIFAALLFVLSILMSWGGLIYAANNPGHLIIGMMISVIGYILVFGVIHIYALSCEDE